MLGNQIIRVGPHQGLPDRQRADNCARKTGAEASPPAELPDFRGYSPGGTLISEGFGNQSLIRQLHVTVPGWVGNVCLPRWFGVLPVRTLLWAHQPSLPLWDNMEFTLSARGSG